MSTSTNNKKRTSKSRPKPQKTKTLNEKKKIQTVDDSKCSKIELDENIMALIDKQFQKAESALDEIINQYEEINNFDDVVYQGEELIALLQHNLNIFKDLEEEVREVAITQTEKHQQDTEGLQGEIMGHISKINETGNMCNRMHQELRESISQHSDFRIKIKETLKNDWKSKQQQIKNSITELKRKKK